MEGPQAPVPSAEDQANAMFARVMEAVNEVLNSTIDDFKETMREEVRKETQTIVAFAKKELEDVEARVTGQINKIKEEALQEMKGAAGSANSLVSRAGKQVDEAIKAGVESGMLEITTTVEKYKKHIETAGQVLSTFRTDMEKLRTDTSTAVAFVRDLVGRGYSPEIIEKQFRDRVKDIASLQGQINSPRRNGHRNGG